MVQWTRTICAAMINHGMHFVAFEIPCFILNRLLFSFFAVEATLTICYMRVDDFDESNSDLDDT